MILGHSAVVAKESAAIARTTKLQQDLLLRMEETEQRHQEWLDAKKEFDDRRTNLTHKAEVLRQIASRNTKDLRALTKGLERRSAAALGKVKDDKVKDDIEGEKMQKGFLDSCWWHAGV